MRREPFESKQTALLAALALMVMTTLPAIGNDEETPPPPVGLRHSLSAQGQHLDVVVPGRLLDHAWPRLGPDGPRTLLLLVAPENAPDGPRTLLRLPWADSGTNAPVVLATDLPECANALTQVATSSSAIDTVLLGEPGVIYRLGFADDRVTRSVLAEHAGLDLRAQPRAISGHGIPIAEVGSLRVLGNDTTATEPLPVRARRKRAGLVLESPPVTVLDRGADRLPLYAIGPEPLGGLRLRSILIDPEIEGEGRWNEVWSILPGPESVEDSVYLLQDGRPRLLVATMNAEKLAIFGHKRLRSYPLLADRTRQGKNSSLDAESTARRWQRVDIVVADVDDNGKDDLLVAQLDGLGGGKLAIDAYMGKGSGTYDVRVRKTIIDRSVDGWIIGHDFDHDIEPDLLALTGNTMALYPGAVTKTKKRSVASKSSWEVDLADHVVEGAEAPGVNQEAAVEASIGTTGAGVEAPALGRPTAVDLDGDGQRDIILTTRNQRGRGRLHVLLMRPN